MPEHLLHGVADTRYLSGEFVKDGKPAFAKYCSDDVADVLEVISQQRDCRNDCTDAGNNRAECAKQCHESAAQFCGHWAYRRTQYVQPCAADVQGTLHCTQSAAADFGCRTRHLAADTEDGRTHLGLADGLPRIGQPVSNDCLSCAEEIFHSTCHAADVNAIRPCNAGKDLSRNAAGLGDKSSYRIAAPEPYQSIFQAAQRLTDIGNIPAGAGVFQHAQ